MQQVPEIHMLLHESLLHNNRPLNSSKFALEKAKPRSMEPVRANRTPTTLNASRESKIISFKVFIFLCLPRF